MEGLEVVQEEVAGPIDPHEIDVAGRGSVDSVHAVRVWNGGPKLLVLASGQEVKVLPGEWVVTISYDTPEEYLEDGELRVRTAIKTLQVPMPDAAVRSLFGHLFPEEVGVASEEEVVEEEAPLPSTDNEPKLLGETPEELKARQKKELAEIMGESNTTETL